MTTCEPLHGLEQVGVGGRLGLFVTASAIAKRREGAEVLRRRTREVRILSISCILPVSLSSSYQRSTVFLFPSPTDQACICHPHP
jgi:hypothetical protein